MPRRNDRDPFDLANPVHARDRRFSDGQCKLHSETVSEESRQFGVKMSIQHQRKDWARMIAMVHAEERGIDLVPPNERDLLDTPLSQILNEPRIVNTLEKHRIRTLGQLCAVGNSTLVSIPGVGPRSVQLLRQAQELALESKGHG